MRILVKTGNLSREEWLGWRTKGIGGSDVSIIAGINKYKSPFMLWLEKTGQVTPAEEESDYTHFGNVLEPVVKKEFTRRTGLKVRNKRMILQSEEYPFMLADLDGVINENGEMCIFEAKTANAYKQEVWEEGVPMEYVLQVQHYMAVTGAKKAYVAALVGGNHFYYHEVTRDEALIGQIIEMEQRFWEVYVMQCIEPVADGSAATTDYLNNKYSDSNGTTIILPDEAIELCTAYDRVTEKLKALTEEKDSIANQLKNMLKENEMGTVGDRVVKWKQINSTSFDKTRLEKENKAVYDAYCMKTKYRRLSVA